MGYLDTSVKADFFGEFCGFLTNSDRRFARILCVHGSECNQKFVYMMSGRDFHSVGFSERTEIYTIKCLSCVTFYSNSERHFLTQTKDFLPNRKI